MRYAVVSKGLTISQLQTEVERYGGRNLRVATASKQIFCNLDDAGVNKLRAMGCSVTKIGEVKAAVMQPIVAPPTPIAGIPTYTAEELMHTAGYEDLRAMMVPPLYGEGFTGAVIDTGIRETHEKIAGRVVYSKNYTSDPMRDGFNHGSAVASVIVAAAPLANLLNMKVLNDKGEGFDEDVVMAIDDCISLQDTNPAIAPSIINLSLGAPDDGNPDNPMRVVCRAAIDRGIWIEAAAGNNGPTPYSIMSPACEKYVFATGSLKLDPFSVSDFSGRGPTIEGLTKPDVMFFGEDIELASSESDTAMVAKSGTSFATPFHTGAALLFHEGVLKYGGVSYGGEEPFNFPKEMAKFLTPQQLIDDYLKYICAKPAGVSPGKDTDYGYGMLYAPLVVRTLSRAVTPALTLADLLSPVISIAILGFLGMVIGRTFR